MAVYTLDLVICPWCGGKSGQRVDHLYAHAPTNFGPWYCDECGEAFDGRVNDADDISVMPIERSEKRQRSIVLLKLRSKEGPVFFVMDHSRFKSDDETPDAVAAMHLYFFEEHSCPTNWLRDCVEVIADGEVDAHGILEFVRAIDVARDFDVDQANWLTMFPECNKTVEVDQ